MRYTPAGVKTYRKRLMTLERTVSLPVKLIAISLSIFAIYPVLRSAAGGGPYETSAAEFFGTANALRVIVFSIFAYSVATVTIWALLYFWKRSRDSIAVLKGIVIAIFVTDIFFLSLWLYLEGEPLKSNLFWIYCLLVIRNTIFFPGAAAQTILTFAVIGSYGGTCLIKRIVGAEPGLGAFCLEELNTLVLKIAILVLVNLSYHTVKRALRIRAGLPNME